MQKVLVTTLVCAVVISWLSGCATSVKRSDSQAGSQNGYTANNSTASGSNGTAGSSASGNSDENAKADPLSSFHLADSQAPEIKDEELESIPTEVNPLVEKWITYFQGRGHDHMERYLSRSTRYEKLMKKVLRDNGVPEDLFYIALIESGFTARATSHASAVGYWQFIRGTGKRYGLEISKFVDERRDPVMATQAAAEYFKGLYSVFGSWYLSMASYNVGENRVKKEVMKNTTRDFWELAKKSRLPKETINYVPKFIAAKLIAKDPAKYGFEGIDYMPPVEFETVSVKTSVNLRLMAEKLGTNYEDFKAINPKFKGEIAPLRGNTLNLRVPPDVKDRALAAANDSSVEKVEYVADKGETEQYRIRSGDSLHTIARRYRTTVAYLRDLNDIPKGKKLRVGMKLMVPDRTPVRPSVVRAQSSGPVHAPTIASQSNVDSSSGAQTQAAIAGTKAVEQATATASTSVKSLSSDLSDGASKYYIVQNGDSLFSIAQKYNTTVAELKKLNKIRRGRMIKIGLKLRLPGDVNNGDDHPENSKSTQNSGRRHTKSKVHVVRRGDTLLKIADRYDVSVQQLKNKNKMKKISKVLVGERLLIPRAIASE